jgi:hypothetical protein
MPSKGPNLEKYYRTGIKYFLCPNFHQMLPFGNIEASRVSRARDPTQLCQQAFEFLPDSVRSTMFH